MVTSRRARQTSRVTLMEPRLRQGLDKDFSHSTHSNPCSSPRLLHGGCFSFLSFQLRDLLLQAAFPDFPTVCGLYMAPCSLPMPHTIFTN